MVGRRTYLSLRHKAHVQLTGRAQELYAITLSIQVGSCAHVLTVHHCIVVPQARPLIELQPALIHFIA